MSATRVLVLGASGMLGSMVADYLSRDAGLEITATVRSPEYLERGRRLLPDVRWLDLDAGDPDAPGLPVLFDGQAWVVNAIGVIKPLIREDDPVEVERAIRVNSLWPHEMAKIAACSGARVIQIATDCVYSGVRGRYAEKDAHDPTDVYGKTKSLGEVRAPGFLHLRCSIIGPEPRAHRSLLGWFLSQKPGATVPGYVNHRWNGLTTLHFAKLCGGIIREDLPLAGLRHVIPADDITKRDLLGLFAAHFRRPDIVIDPREAAVIVDRTLVTEDAGANAALWRAAGYASPPAVADMVAELASHDYRLGNLASTI
jgi:dTDP-4-dehydrorhamnose reductase